MRRRSRPFRTMRPILVAGLLLVSALLQATLPAAAAPKSVPAPPQSYVLDEPQALSPQGRQAISRLAEAHAQATGEQVVVAIFQSLDGEDLVDFTARVFKEWKIGRKGKDNGVLLALYWKNRKARIEVGYGLEPLLTDAKAKGVLEDYLIPGLKQGQTDLAVLSSVRELLRIIESPVVQNAPESWKPVAPPQPRGQSSSAPPLSFWIAFGAIWILISLLDRIKNAEAHYTARGWSRSTPWGRIRIGGSGWDGGFGGGGFGGGGFSGGGGRSGGGGASGSW